MLYKLNNILKSSTYGYLFDEAMSGEAMALNVVNKINNKLKFLYRENNYLTPALRCLLSNALIQPHFALCMFCLVSKSNKEIIKHRIQITQNKCMRFYLQSDKFKTYIL